MWLTDSSIKVDISIFNGSERCYEKRTTGAIRAGHGIIGFVV
ncbi:hypothetical protein [Calorimonas adulescens]|nr:hypothetical protein [Calorimonas adulescens]